MGHTTANQLGEAEWLERRKTGIGASEAAAVCGISPYSSPAKVYAQKKGLVEPFEQTEAMYFGHAFEDFMVAEFTKRTGLRVHSRQAFLRSKRVPFMLATLDGKVGKDAIFESKTGGFFQLGAWEGDSIPDDYMVQVQHSLFVAERQRAHVVALIGGQRWFYHIVERDEAMIENILKIERVFWQDYFEAGVMPPPDGSQDATKLRQFLFPQDDETTLALSSDDEAKVAQWILGWSLIKEKIEELATAQEVIKQEIMDLMGEAETIQIEAGKVTWKNTKPGTRLDGKALAEAHPAIAAEFQIEVPSQRRFNIYPKKA
jgi:putative phage-type endonuclease